MRIRALSCTQPWASLVVAGVKKVETRPMTTRHRGWLAIHATTEVPNIQLCDATPFRHEILKLGLMPHTMPRGVVIGAVEVVGCTPTDDLHLQRRLSPLERALGDYEAGRAAWLLGRAVVFPTTIEARGFPWLFWVDVPESWLP